MTVTVNVNTNSIWSPSDISVAGDDDREAPEAELPEGLVARVPNAPMYGNLL